MTSKDFISELESIALGYKNEVPKRELFALAKEFQKLPLNEVEKLLQEEDENHRLGAVAILDWKARNKKTTEAEKHSIYQVYIVHNERIDNWGMVDRAAPYVVGGYLFDKDRSPLYELAKSTNAMERRTAIVSTYFFIRKDEVDDTFKIAEILINDENEYVQKAVGSWVREAGKRDGKRLLAFLDKYAAIMPRVSLRYMLEKLNSSLKKHYLNLKN